MNQAETVEKTKELLRHYYEDRQRIINIKQEIKETIALWDLPGAPASPSISGGGGGGTSGSQEERIAIRKEYLQERLTTLQNQLTKLEPLFNTLDRSLESLKSFNLLQHNIIWDVYVGKEAWETVAMKHFLSRGKCMREAEKGVDSLARMIFGGGETVQKLPLDI